MYTNHVHLGGKSHNPDYRGISPMKYISVSHLLFDTAFSVLDYIPCALFDLIGLLKKSAPSRVVTVSSIMHKFAPKLDVGNINCDKYFPKNSHYNLSKLAVIIFSNELARQIEGTGTSGSFCLYAKKTFHSVAFAR